MCLCWLCSSATFVLVCFLTCNPNVFIHGGIAASEIIWLYTLGQTCNMAWTVRRIVMIISDSQHGTPHKCKRYEHGTPHKCMRYEHGTPHKCIWYEHVTPHRCMLAPSPSANVCYCEGFWKMCCDTQVMSNVTLRSCPMWRSGHVQCDAQVVFNVMLRSPLSLRLCPVWHSGHLFRSDCVQCDTQVVFNVTLRSPLSLRCPPAPLPVAVASSLSSPSLIFCFLPSFFSSFLLVLASSLASASCLLQVAGERLWCLSCLPVLIF